MTRYQSGVVYTEDHIAPAGSVPDTYENKYYERCQCRRYNFADIGSESLFEVLLHFCKRLRQGQRIEHIILHPVTERHMPPRPELGHVKRHIRLTEILGEMHPEELGNADDDVDTARKVAIHLNSVKQHAEENSDAAVRLRIILRNDLLNDDRTPLSYDHFLKIAPQHAVDAGPEVPFIERALCVKIRCKCIVTADRSLDNLREP